MTTATPARKSDQHDPDDRSAVRLRDADKTRQLLLHAARRRFAQDGYAGTTVREIAADAGVNVALINRYFTSKEGLFEACLNLVVDDLDLPNGNVAIEQIVASMINQVAGQPSGEHPLQLLLLLRSSGDERADLIRRSSLQTFAEKMAAAAGWSAGDAGTQRLLLRAQIALSTGLGIVLLRSATALEPLTSATALDFQEPLSDVISALLSP